MAFETNILIAPVVRNICMKHCVYILDDSCMQILIWVG